MVEGRLKGFSGLIAVKYIQKIGQFIVAEVFGPHWRADYGRQAARVMAHPIGDRKKAVVELLDHTAKPYHYDLGWR